MAWERIYTINEWWDRARLGVADVGGVPHVYQSPFDSSLDDYSAFYLVSPIDSELLALVLEDWEIWLRWSDAFDRGDASRETHPSLPNDRERHEEIQGLMIGRLVVDPIKNRKVMGSFRRVGPGWNGFEAEWNELDGKSLS